MSNRREEDSRPGAKVTSQRNTARDVPAAKYREGSVGTIAPRGLRGPSLLPGQGAPERIVPEEVELAVLRDAETLDGPNVARAGRRLPEPRGLSPTPVPVEVPRARSAPPSIDEYTATPPSPSARSIQSGTLMSIGSVDPRAPTELSLPSPRPLSVAERAAYLRPGAVVDRTPVYSTRELPGVVDSGRFSATERPTAPNSLPYPPPSSRKEAAPSVPSARASSRQDSVAPQAQHFARAPRSYAPTSARPPGSAGPSVRPESVRSAPLSASDIPPQYRVHSQLDALPHDYHDDSFDLRSASTLREPLASRKQQESSDWTAHAPESESYAEPEPSARVSRHSSSAVTILVDRGHDLQPPESERARPQRLALPLSWVLGAVAFAVALALLVAWLVRPSGSHEALREVDGRATAAAPTTMTVPVASEVAATDEAPRAPVNSAAAAPNLSAPRMPALKAAPHAPRPAASAAPDARPSKTIY